MVLLILAPTPTTTVNKAVKQKSHRLTAASSGAKRHYSRAKPGLSSLCLHDCCFNDHQHGSSDIPGMGRHGAGKDETHVSTCPTCTDGGFPRLEKTAGTLFVNQNGLSQRRQTQTQRKVRRCCVFRAFHFSPWHGVQSHLYSTFPSLLLIPLSLL